MLNSLRKMLLKPRLGMRRCSGIWPPSKPRIIREPVRERCPLCPRVEVLPMPDPMPRPTRLRFSVDFFGARIFDKFMARFLLLNDLDQMWHLGDHAADCRIVGALNHLIEPGETQPFNHQFLLPRRTNRGAHPFQVNLAAVTVFLRRHFLNPFEAAKLLNRTFSVLVPRYPLQLLR